MNEADRDLGRRWFDEVWNKGQREAIGQLFAPNVLVHDGSTTTSGPGAFYQFYDRINAAFAGTHVEVEDNFTEGDRICVRWTCTATHNGPGLGVPPTGRKIRVTGISIARVANQQFVEVWQNWDMLGMMEQIKNLDQSPTYIAETKSAAVA
jgi:steroid delta-isomerase-like uncharacterized protein